MRVLIVDDSRLIREYLKGLLDDMEMQCVEAANGSEALTVLREGEGFDVMLLDMNLPVMDGLECVRRVRAAGLHPAMKVMMVATEREDAFFRAARAGGVDAFLLQPFTGEALREKLMGLGCRAV